MALTHLALRLPHPPCRSCRNGVAHERHGGLSDFVSSRTLHCAGSPRCGGGGDGLVAEGLLPSVGSRSGGRGVLSRGKMKLEDSPTEGQVRASVEVPVSCYQLIGVTEKAEKDEIVKSVIELKSSEVEEGYTMDVILSRQDLLMDVRDKLLFEPEYAGNSREKIPPRSSLRMPWAWLPAALCLLQEIGEEKLVLDIGRAALQHPDAKPYTHDLLLSMALAELSFAKAAFEKTKVSQGFEALARAQYLLRSKTSLEKMPLLSQIEESLEELAPACTLEILNLPCTPENEERRSGAISALRELLRQGLEVEASCRVQDWPSFLSQALSKLMATEIVDLLSWDNLAVIRKNKKSLESQNQRVVIDYNCFYLAMIAHVALGFSRRQLDLITKAKTICDCLIASEGINLKFVDGLCSLLLGQGADTAQIEKLCQTEVNGSPIMGNFDSTLSKKDAKGGLNASQSLEMFLKDAVLDTFPDTRDCSPSLANFFGGQRKIFSSGKQIKENAKTNPWTGLRSSTINLPHELRLSDESPNMNSTRHLGEAVKQLAPANLQSQLSVSKSNGSVDSSSVQLKRELRMRQKKFWERWCAIRDSTGRTACFAVVGCIVFSAVKLSVLQFGLSGRPCKLKSSYLSTKTNTLAWKVGSSDHSSDSPAFIDRKNIVESLGEMVVIFRKLFEDPTKEFAQSKWPDNHCTHLPSSGIVMDKRAMPFDDAESLVKEWQTAKAEALGPHHKAVALANILDEPMLSKWQDLADRAKARSCFWRFVLLKASITRADIVSDGVGKEAAEIEAVLEEAAELVDESQSKNPNYYSTYKVIYLLKRQFDGSWRFYGGDIQT